MKSPLILAFALLALAPLRAELVFEDRFDARWDGDPTLATGAGKIAMGRWFQRPTAQLACVTDEKALSLPASLVLELGSEAPEQPAPPSSLSGFWGTPTHQLVSPHGPLTFSFALLANRIEGNPDGRVDITLNTKPATGQVRLRLLDEGQLVVSGPGNAEASLAKISADRWYIVEVHLPDPAGPSAKGQVTLHTATGEGEPGEALGAVPLSGFPTDIVYTGFSLMNNRPGLRLYFDNFVAE